MRNYRPRMVGAQDARAAVQRFYEAEANFLDSDDPDFASVAVTLTEDVLILEPVSLPYGGAYRGRDSFERWMRAFKDAWSALEVRDSEMWVLGDTVFSRSHVYATARVTGRSADWPLLQLFLIDDGRVAELRPFHWDTAAMLPALGRGANDHDHR